MQNANQSWSLCLSSGSGAILIGTRAMHGGQPGSPGDSPFGARPDFDDNAPRREGLLMTSTRIAAVQATPVFLDREATIEKMGRLAKEAAGNGAALAVFPEAFVPTYPDWVWRTTPLADDDWYARFSDQSVEVPGPACAAIGAIAAELGIYLAAGVNE